ncbi:2985_t:CDS:2, partial [Gigaspora margarita]
MKTRKPQDFGRKSIWAQIYEPIKSIQNTWFKDLLSEITEEDPISQRIFRQFANYCIIEATFSKEWKCAQIYPILKGTNWNYDLGNTRPIALLETFR